MDYPSFFESHIKTVIDSYNSEREKITNGCGFVFITDLHIHLNGRASVPLILELGKCTDVRTVLCGGDHCWAFGSKAQCIADITDSLCYMDPIRGRMELFHAKGNHDATVRSSGELNTGFTMPYEQTQQMLAQHMSIPSGYVAGKTYFFHDDEDAMVRYIVLDTNEPHAAEATAWGIGNGMKDEQLRWLADIALRLPGDAWSAIVMGHIPCCSEMKGYCPQLDALRCVLEAFKHKSACEYGDFSLAQGELVAYLCGHNHVDSSEIQNGLLHISTGCDAYCKDDRYSRNVGEPENTLFDLFLLDKERKQLKIFRIGAGSSRQFDY